MKASELFAERGELHHKTRTAEDLIRHISTREKNTSNYSVFLGAGASVTSGIRTASTLVNEWMLELYERFNRQPAATITEAVDYFKNSHASWFNPTNPYSSLFEKNSIFQHSGEDS